MARIAPILLTITGLCLWTVNVWAAEFFVRPVSGEYGTEDGTSYANAFDGAGDISWVSLGTGDTLYICGNFYGETFDVQASGISGYPLILDGGYPGDPGIIDANYVQSIALRCVGQSHIIIRNLTLRNATSSGVGLNSNNVSLDNITIENTGGIGALIKSADLEFKNSTITNTADSGCEITQSNNAHLDNIIVINCGTPGVSTDGIFIGDGSENYLVENCTVVNNQGTSAAFDSSGDSANPISGTFRYCLAKNSTSGGFCASAGTEQSMTVNIEYCIAYECLGALFHAKECVTLNLYNCIAYALAENNYISINMAGWNDVDTRTITIKNCILVANSFQPTFAIRAKDTLISDHNCWLNLNNTQTAFMQFIHDINPNVEKTWEQWQNDGYDIHSHNQDPACSDISGANFYLLPISPCIDTGTDVGLTQDFAGQAVPQGTAPEIGAYEYVLFTSTPTPTPTSKFLLVYPQPSRDKVNFRFKVTAPQLVKMNIYNPAGMLVSTINSQIDPQQPELIWQAPKSAAGVYFYTTQIGTQPGPKGKITIKPSSDK